MGSDMICIYIQVGRLFSLIASAWEKDFNGTSESLILVSWNLVAVVGVVSKLTFNSCLRNLQGETVIG